MLASGELGAGEIRSSFAMTPTAVSQHLRALREAGLVHVRAHGQRRIYRLAPEGVQVIQDWLFGLRRAAEPATLAARVQARRLGIAA